MTNPSPYLNVQMEPIDMHGPIEVEVVLYARIPSGKIANMRVKMPPGLIPTRAAIKEVLDDFLAPENMAENSIPEGTRLLHKPEFVEMVTKRETGKAIPLPGNQDYVPATVDIPHQMLVYAIIGAGFKSMEQGEHFTQRGLAEHTGNQWNPAWSWNKAKLQAQPDEILLAIYKEVA